VLAITFDLICVGVDSEDLVAPAPEALIYRVASVTLGLPRHASHRDALVGKERGRCVFDCDHDDLLSRNGHPIGGPKPDVL